MKGIILFVDDKVFDLNSNENLLYRNLRKKAEYPVLPLKDLSEFDTAISSISSIKAIVLDWEFIKDTDPDIEGIDLPTDNPESILEKRVFSLVYVFTHKTIDESTKYKLRELYKNKITFNNKTDIDQTDEYAEKILYDIKEMENINTGLTVPFYWSQQINKTVQNIFWELEKADATWIKEFYTVALNDIQKDQTKQGQAEKLAASKEVISLFNTLISEKMISDNEIAKKIIEVQDESQPEDDQKLESYFEFLKYLYFREIKDDTPISTGTVVKYADKNYVIISPECDFRYIFAESDSYVDCLEFSNKPFTELQHVKERKKDKKLQAFTQTEPRFHILPFGYKDQFIDAKPVVIDFRTGFRSIKTSELQDKAEKYKILMPYINEIRQRFLAYKGRIGVPAISDNLKKTLIDHSQTQANEGTIT